MALGSLVVVVVGVVAAMKQFDDPTKTDLSWKMVPREISEKKAIFKQKMEQ